MHVAGDPLDVSIAKGGADSSDALEIAYRPGGQGWAGLTHALPADKKVWSGAAGIRFWVKGTGVGTRLEVRFGKRGFQSWAATMTVNRIEGMYVSVPFAAFDDIGGGDGILDLSGITRLWFFVNGGAADTILLDNISIGADGDYTADTRAALAEGYAAKVGTFEDFESYASDEEMENVWQFENMGNYTLTKAGMFEGAQAVKVVPQTAWATMYRTMPATDFTEITSISFAATAGTYVIQLVSEYNVVECSITTAVDGDRVGADLADFYPQKDSDVYDVSKVDRLVIGLNNKGGSVAVIDDIVFSDRAFVPADHDPKVGVFEDFEQYADTADMQAVWQVSSGNGTLTLTGDENKAMQIEVPDSGWTTVYCTFPNVDFTGIASVQFDASVGRYEVRLIDTDNRSNIVSAAVLQAGDKAGANVSDMLLQNVDGKKIKALWITALGKGTATVDNIVFSDVAYQNPTPAANLPETFETLDTDNVGRLWKANGGATLSIEAEESGNKRLKIESVKAGDFAPDTAYFAGADLRNTIGFRFKMETAFAIPALKVQIGKYGNVYEVSRQVYGSNNIRQIVVLYDAMSLSSGSGELDLAGIDYMRFFVTQWVDDGSFKMYIDDLEFLTAENYTPTKRTIDDFESYADDAALQSRLKGGVAATATLKADGENRSAVLHPNNGGTDMQYDITDDGDYQDCYAITFDITAEKSIATFEVRLSFGWKARKQTITLQPGQKTTVTLYLNQFIGDDAWPNMHANYLYFYITHYHADGNAIEIDNIAFLVG